MTIEPHQPPPSPDDDSELPRGEWPSMTSLLAIVALVVVVALLFAEFA